MRAQDPQWPVPIARASGCNVCSTVRDIKLSNLSYFPRSHSIGIRFDGLEMFCLTGVVSVTSTSAVDQVLSASRLPTFSQQTVESVRESCSQLAPHIDNEFVPAMIVFDLAIVSCRTWDASLKLLEMSQSRLPSLPSPRSPVSEKVDVVRVENLYGFR